MNLKGVSDIGFKSLLSALPKDKIQEFTNFLSQEELHRLEKTPLVSFESILDSENERFVDAIDPSWIHFIYEKLNHKDLKIIIAAFPVQKNSLEVLFNIQSENISLSHFAKTFIRNLTYSKLLQLQETAYPIYSLSQEFMYAYLFLDKPLLKNIIFGMGLFDLKDNLDTLVDKTKLQTIKEGLETKDLKFLKEISKEPRQLISQSIGLNFWNGKIEELKTLLFQRGINRIAKILSSCSYSLYWHFSLIVPIEDAKLIKKLMVKSIDPPITSSLVAQMEKTRQFFLKSEGV